ncbi:MAG: hypothetical protein HC793_03240 [Aquincola sp.]|nr:hypothetical protein [Aquincola sp.]
MSVYSMTGYASASAGEQQRTEAGAAIAPVASAEVRSVNGRFLDLTLKLPDELRGLEPALRELVAASVKRGKVELRLSGARDASATLPMPGAQTLMALSRVESMVQGWLPKAAPLSVHEILQWCGKSGSGEALDEPALAAARDVKAAVRAFAGQSRKLVIVEFRQHAAQVRPRLDQVFVELDRHVVALARSGQIACPVRAAMIQAAAVTRPKNPMTSRPPAEPPVL